MRALALTGARRGRGWTSYLTVACLVVCHDAQRHEFVQLSDGQVDVLPNDEGHIWAALPEGRDRSLVVAGDAGVGITRTANAARTRSESQGVTAVIASLPWAAMGSR